MVLFTHNKRSYLSYERNAIDFHITVKHINFTTNQYFLANSNYVIFRKENKGKKFQSKTKVTNVNGLKHIAIDQKIKFRACLLQDLAHRYLERYIPKEKKFIIRQVTEVPGEELYVDCGFIRLPVHIYGMQPSGQDIIVDFVDPSKKASGTVHLLIEHEPRMQVKHILPSVSSAFRRLFKKDSTKSPLPPSVLVTNKDKLDFLKSQKQDHHRSQKYDDSDEETSDAEDTLSESEDEEDGTGRGMVSRKFNQSFLIANGSSKNMKKQESLELGAHIFNESEFQTTVAASPEKSSNKSHADACEDTPRSQESVSTMTASVKDHPTPRSSAKALHTLPDLPEEGGEDSGAENIGHPVHLNYVPFSPPSGPVAMLPAPDAEEEEEVWEQPSEEWLNSSVEVTRDLPGPMVMEATSARSGLRIPPPIITDPAKFAPARELTRSQSASASVPQLKKVPSFHKPPPVATQPQQLARVPSFHAAGRAPNPPVLVLPDRSVNRSNSEPGAGNSVRVLLEMTSEDEVDMISSRSASSNELPPRIPAAPVFSAGPGARSIKVPVRLTKGDDVHAALSSLQHTPPVAPAPTHGHHRSFSAGDAPNLTGVSVKDLRRNFERPPLAKESSGSTTSSTYSDEQQQQQAPRYASLSQSNLPPQPRIVFNRTESERSYSTLSTHDHIPKQPVVSHGAPTAKLLMPVRLKSSLQEQALHRESGYNGNNNTRQQSSEHHMHRAATVPAMVPPVRMTPPEHAPRREYSIAQHDAYEYEQRHAPQSHVPHRTGSVPHMPYSSSPASQERDYFSHAQDHHHHLHRTSTAPALSHSDYARDLQNAAYGGASSSAYRNPSPSTHGHGQEHQHQHQHGLHRAGSHMMAPPIRLQANEFVPPTYDRYTHVLPSEPAHHRHHHQESEHRYVGDYAPQHSYADRRGPRGIYA